MKNDTLFKAIMILTHASVACGATPSPVTSIFSDAPSENWEHAMFSGNGDIGVMARGFPYEEVLHFSHGELYLPVVREHKPLEMAPHLPTFRRLCLDGEYTRACLLLDEIREIMADPSIDAVVISTPDHWHVPMSLMALEAGKDVFCEKPTLTIAEGRTLVDAVKQRNAVFQMGLEDRSLTHYHKVVEWLRNGAIGDLERVDVSLPEGLIHPLEQETPVPDGLNYELFVGPAEFLPYTPHRTSQRHWRSGLKASDDHDFPWDFLPLRRRTKLKSPPRMHQQVVSPSANTARRKKGSACAAVWASLCCVISGLPLPPFRNRHGWWHATEPPGDTANSSSATNKKKEIEPCRE